MIGISSSIPLWLLLFFFKPAFFLSIFLQFRVINISIISINNIFNSFRHILHVTVRLINLINKLIIFPYRTTILSFNKRRNILCSLFVLLILVILSASSILIPPVFLLIYFPFLRLLVISLKVIAPIWILIVLILWILLILILILLPCWNQIASIIFPHI